jgi:hypothetical protein
MNWSSLFGASAATRLSFPNASRSYDATRHAVRFWGYANAMEISFFVTDDALRRVEPEVQASRAGYLKAFDAHRDAIIVAATRVYAQGRRGSYELSALEF